MYSNIGKKIQTVGKVFAWIGIIVCVLIGAIMLYGASQMSNYAKSVQTNISAVVIIIVGSIACWLSSLTLVGFGKLIEDTSANRKLLEKISDKE